MWGVAEVWLVLVSGRAPQWGGVGIVHHGHSWVMTVPRVRVRLQGNGQVVILLGTTVMAVSPFLWVCAPAARAGALQAVSRVVKSGRGPLCVMGRAAAPLVLGLRLVIRLGNLDEIDVGVGLLPAVF